MREEGTKRIVGDERKEEVEKSQSMNILVVDDEKEICRMFTKWLSLEGHRVKSVLTGKKAVKRVKKKYYDIVFLDIVMPGIPAIEVLEKIKKISPKTKVIVITGKLMDVDKDLSTELRQKGASEYLQKPFKINDIREIIRRVCPEIAMI